MPKYQVEVRRVSYRYKTFTVEADDWARASQIAKSMASNTDFGSATEKHANIETMSCHLVEGDG